MAEAAHCQLYLVVEAGAGALDRLAAAISAAPIASVLLRPSATRSLAAGEVKPLVEFIQARGIAALIETDAQLARVVRADGVHVLADPRGFEAYALAREIVGGGGIVGANAGGSRHIAMELGEAGADYVAFNADDVMAPLLGEDADTLGSNDEVPVVRETLVSWWSAIFEMPSVAFDAATADVAQELAAAGADFVAVLAANGESPAAVRERVAAFARAIDAARLAV